MTQNPSESVVTAVHDIAKRARVAARFLANASRAQKDAALHQLADALVANQASIIAENQKDLQRGRKNGMSQGLQDRLALNEERIAGIAEAMRALAALPDPVGEVVRGSYLPNGAELRQIRVPMGVVGMIYEARPNVTADAVGLTLKSGNAVILRGGSAAKDTNVEIVRVLSEALEAAGFPPNCVQTIDDYGREGAVALMRARGLVDVLFPRGGAGLIRTVVEEAKVPAIETGVGNCHVYVDAEVDQEQALAIVVNSKTHRVSVCNAAETLLVHRERAKDFLPKALAALGEKGVLIHGCPQTLELVSAGVEAMAATEEDWETEYSDYQMAVRVVESFDQALEHIRAYSTGHTEAICTTSLGTAKRFTSEVDAAVVNVNASTRFTDGGQFGLGAEIGISTQKTHARGPMGLAELTTTKWILTGDGQIRI